MDPALMGSLDKVFSKPKLLCPKEPQHWKSAWNTVAAGLRTPDSRSGPTPSPWFNDNSACDHAKLRDKWRNLTKWNSELSEKTVHSLMICHTPQPTWPAASFLLPRDCKNHLNVTQILGLPLHLLLNYMLPICLAALPCIFQKDAGDDVCQCINSSASRWNGCLPFFHPKRCETWAWLIQIFCIYITWWKRTNAGFPATKTYYRINLAKL